MEVNYIDIGKRIKEFRKCIGVSQERLSELTNLSVSHMSHIETGSTKLGLPTIVKIANALNVSMDELLCGSLKKGKAIKQNEFAEILSDCLPEEINLIIDIAKATKESLRINKINDES